MARREQKVKLGTSEYEVIPQPWPYLKHELEQFGLSLSDVEAFGAMQEGNVHGAIESIGERAHALLNIFIPELMPVHRWNGYASAEAMEEGTYDKEAARKAPAFAEIVDAFEIAFRVNRFDVVGHLKGVLPADAIRRELRIELANRMAGEMPSPNESSTSPLPSGASDSKMPSEPSPTPPQRENEDSPSPASTPSPAGGASP
jgi:hypothetical protein